jgi:hypothetical protein
LRRTSFDAENSKWSLTSPSKLFANVLISAQRFFRNSLDTIRGLSRADLYNGSNISSSYRMEQRRQGRLRSVPSRNHLLWKVRSLESPEIQQKTSNLEIMMLSICRLFRRLQIWTLWHLPCSPEDERNLFRCPDEGKTDQVALCWGSREWNMGPVARYGYCVRLLFLPLLLLLSRFLVLFALIRIRPRLRLCLHRLVLPRTQVLHSSHPKQYSLHRSLSSTKNRRQEFLLPPSREFRRCQSNCGIRMAGGRLRAVVVNRYS